MTLTFECETFDDAAAKAHAANILGMGFVVGNQWVPDRKDETLRFVVTVYPDVLRGETPASILKGGE